MPTEKFYMAPACAFKKDWKGWSAFLGSEKARPKKLGQHLEAAERLREEHGGKIPCCKWLRTNGFRGLEDCMRVNPDAFSHFEMDRQAKTVEQYVSIAEGLARDNGGVLPCVRWLCVNGHRSMEAVMRRNPEKFDHIQQESKRSPTEELVLLAERIAEEHGGVLPGTGWLRRNGHGKIDSSIYQHPESYSHIKKSKVREKREPERRQ